MVDLHILPVADAEGLVTLYTFDGQSDTIIDEAGHSADIAVAAGFSLTGNSSPFAVISNSPLSDVQVANDMDLSLDLAFLPDGRMIVVDNLDYQRNAHG